MLLYKREVPGGALPLWFPMEPYRGGGALKAPAPLENPDKQPRGVARIGARPLRHPTHARYGTVGSTCARERRR